MNDIAVIMSVYHADRLDYLKEALESLYCQVPRPDIYVQQDGKVEDSIEAYLSKAEECGQIVYLGKRDDNKGLAMSLNGLLEKVLVKPYTYIARMDADDISVPERMAGQYTFMEKNKDIDVVGGYIEEFSDDNSYHKTVQYPLKHDEMYRFFAKRVPLAHVTAFFRRSFFEKAGLYPVESPTNEDTLLWMKGFRDGCHFANIPQKLVRVRVSSDFFRRRGGWKKAWNDFQDRIKVIQTLGYNRNSYIYALGMLFVNISPAFMKKFLYQRLR